MNHPVLVMAASTILLLGACSAPRTETRGDNPLLASWDTPFGAPPFDRIREEDFLPAFEKAIEMQDAEIEAICTSAEEPSFENTIEALEFSGSKLDEIHLWRD